MLTACCLVVMLRCGAVVSLCCLFALLCYIDGFVLLVLWCVVVLL